MKNTYAIISIARHQYEVLKNGRAIIASATRAPLTFESRSAAQTFVNIQTAADARHGQVQR